jgi:ubiquinone/menaquinone biosynthesis C-methylase UbiE
MKAAFDDTAQCYDERFTNTSIGRLQRNKVWGYLEKAYGDSFPTSVLELNCGTGEDAVFFGKHHSKVLATDISEQMLAQTASKIAAEKLERCIYTAKLDINLFPADLPDQKYNLIFSNFGGLNCISPVHLQQLLNESRYLLNNDGRIILVIMPRFCAWETLYFVSKLDFSKAFRRRSRKPQNANLGNSEVNTWYHSPADIKKMAVKHYDIINVQPVGISIPPSYLQKTFVAKSGILNKLDALENHLGRYSFFSGLADHYLIDLKLK